MASGLDSVIAIARGKTDQLLSVFSSFMASQ